MFSITTYIKLRSNYVKSIFFGALLLFIVYSFTLVEWKGNRLLNGLQHLQIKVFSKKESDNFDFETLTFSQLMEYLKWPNETACERVGYYGGILVKTTDQMEGQKAFCLDNGVAPALDNCLIYSFGINNEWSFDDFMSESYGCHVYSFDPTMNREEHNRTSKIHFYPIGLGAQNEVLEPNKGRQLKVYSWRGGNNTITSMKIMKLSSIYKMLSQMHGEKAVIDYLKIDIDWEEWSVIPELIESGILDRVRQFGMEIHLTIEGNPNMTEYRRQAKILQRLEKEGDMIRFDSQINGISRMVFKNMGNVISYYAYEMAWYNNKYYHH